MEILEQAEGKVGILATPSIMRVFVLMLALQQVSEAVTDTHLDAQNGCARTCAELSQQLREGTRDGVRR